MTVLKKPQHISTFHKHSFLFTYTVCILLIRQKRVPIWQLFLNNLVHKNTKLKQNYNFNKIYLPICPICNKAGLQENMKHGYEKDGKGKRKRPVLMFID